MPLRCFEEKMRLEIDGLVSAIVAAAGVLPIRAKSRAGAEISDWLEDRFVEAAKGSNLLVDAEAAPKGKTMHPWDARAFFTLAGREEVWIDFKAIKVSFSDSNPDIGTPEKVIKLIKRGSFYIIYLFVFYRECLDGLEFVEVDGSLTKTYFLKDISPTVRRHPKNQLQVNVSAAPVYRSREEFVSLLMTKIREGHLRSMEASTRKLAMLSGLENELQAANSVSEALLRSKLIL